ncbi:DUF3592 domain-containing protein [Streptomonospora nanhaiensis]|uniref:DUF3592 domain-containing protein n=1 Tax=Streptomonospora nanhaiensis TaxID=1323731 RepID=A0A853BMS9_9ACTN|nr:DUF3592 domain-containing protein [Streptomonospora nanhaiensis]MBV2362154.1 DUF3592 domain-containing protein [Streptomonospora nanhaiensis]MBV2364774.1 DUF3592 domain-containing protein [Streptomonospora nanhaiensis]MBX9391021.1 DUF3592 domain-containing protein [Streptomonospora nanhaiensis]NYI96015.1 hypothetical protein [Streptomonospora nanhaiensis]
MALIYPLIPIAAGLAMVGYLLAHLRRTAFFQRHGARVEGEIVGYTETRSSAAMVVRFTTPDGREVHASHDSTGWTASRSGDTVTVSYDPANPERARIVKAPWLSGFVPGLVGVLGVLLVAIGLVLGYFAW